MGGARHYAIKFKPSQRTSCTSCSHLCALQNTAKKIVQKPKGVGTQNTTCCHGISECGMQEVVMNIMIV